jgi:simple sugar transport system permease protein
VVSSSGAHGIEIRLIGDNPRAAQYAGIRIGRNILFVFAVSGGLAGIAGMAEITGVVHRLQDNFSPGYGYTAIIIADLAKFHRCASFRSPSSSGRSSSPAARSSRPGCRR